MVSFSMSSFTALVLLAGTASVASFTSMTPLSMPRTSILSVPRSDILRASTAAEGDNAPSLADKVIKKLEKQEAVLDKKRALAMQQLNKLEESLTELQTKKQEYLNGLELADTPPGGIFSETTARSAVKAFVWRIIAGSVTFITSLRFSGSIATALSIVGSDFFSKSFTMFIGERLMNKSQAGRKAGADGAGRSLAKALIWRLFAICNTLTMAIFIAKDLSIASKIAGSDAIFKTALMFFYERVWAKIEWGKEYEVEFTI
mmetsp:Transcript_104586/g.156634  ORF Transcript_104586/g.156634 Transcript_104586/m.156634 type:complete len:260 (-) Transcript_104586:151-930(-)